MYSDPFDRYVEPATEQTGAQQQEHSLAATRGQRIYISTVWGRPVRSG